MLDRLGVSEEEVYQELANRKRQKDMERNHYQYSISEFTQMINYYKKMERQKWIKEQSQKNIPLWVKIFFNLSCIDYQVYEKYQQREIRKIYIQSFN